MPQTLACKDTT